MQFEYKVNELKSFFRNLQGSIRFTIKYYFPLEFLWTSLNHSNLKITKQQFHIYSFRVPYMKQKSFKTALKIQ